MSARYSHRMHYREDGRPKVRYSSRRFAVLSCGPKQMPYPCGDHWHIGKNRRRSYTLAERLELGERVMAGLRRENAEQRPSQRLKAITPRFRAANGGTAA